MCVKNYSVAAGTMVAASLKYKAVNNIFHLALDQKNGDGFCASVQ